MSRLNDRSLRRAARLALWFALCGTVAAGLAFFFGPRNAYPAIGAAVAAGALVGAAWALVVGWRGKGSGAGSPSTAQARAEAAESELRRLREALDELPCGLEIYDSDDKLIFFNRRVAELYPWIRFERHVGQTFESLLRQSINEGRIPDAIGHEEQWIKERLAIRGTLENPILQSLKGGLWINTYERRSPSNYVVGVRLEVTDLIQKTRELHDSRDGLQAIIRSAAVGIVISDARGQIIDINAAALTLFGVQRDDILARPLSTLIPPLELGPASMPPDARSWRHVARPAEFACHARDGRPLLLNVSVSEIGAADARRFIVIVVDVTERAAADVARHVLEAQLREAQKLESLGTLASGIAHDFNNVLGSIIGNADLARGDIEQGVKDKALYSLSLVGAAAERARVLVRQILTFSRRQSLQRSVQALQPIIDEALNIMRSTLPARVELDIRFADAPLFALVDANQIEQIVVNLCTNAWQATTDRGGRIEIGAEALELTSDEASRMGLNAGPHVRLWFADDGVGMDDATRLRAFEPFFTTKPIGSGTGIGLSVVHGIVKAHDGAIEVDSTPGSGSRFDIYLPAVGAPQTRELAPAKVQSAVLGNGERVLYIDDDEVMPLMVERLLQRAGYVVECYTDPTFGVEAVRARPDGFDLVVTDFNMPVMSGLDVIRALAMIRPTLPTVLISGLVSDELRAQASNLGVSEVLDKQNALEELAVAVHRTLDAARLRGVRTSSRS